VLADRTVDCTVVCSIEVRMPVALWHPPGGPQLGPELLVAGTVAQAAWALRVEPALGSTRTQGEHPT
jgi:hypothetical protein